MTNVFQGSASKFLTRTIARLYANKLQLHRHVLGLFAAFNITCLIGKLYWHYATGRYDCTPLDFWSLIHSWASRLTWTFLFREPDRFLGVKRPSTRYTLLVVGTTEATLLPNLVLHFLALSRARVNARDIYAGVTNAAAALFFWIVLIGLVHWMAWKFLLEDHGHDFEPVTSPLVSRQDVPINIESYSDEAFHGRTSSLDRVAYLSAAYARQRGGNEIRAAAIPAREAIDDVGLRMPQEASTSPDEQNIHEANHTARCHTISRFNYMTQAHAGAHSWWSYPIIPMAFATCATIILILLLILIHDDRKLPRKDSPTIKKSLYLPLGIYLISFYALKHRTRSSLFETFDTPVPEPWKRLFSILPISPAFRNNLTGEVTLTDPRHRAMPNGKAQPASCIDNNAYIKVYNSPPHLCTAYWGHLGRENVTNLRIRPATLRIGFLCLAIFLVFKGFWNTFFTYDVPNLDIIRLIPHLPHETLIRAMRIVRIWQGLIFSGLVLFVATFLYAIFMIVSLLVLWGHVILQYAERENRGRGEAEGQIRLE